MDTPYRAARDHLIDLLEIGDTFPLTDLNVVADQLKVAFGGVAKIPIEDAQIGVKYELCGPNGESLAPPVTGNGDGGVLRLETPPVKENITYRIRAIKAARQAVLPPDRAVTTVSLYLSEGAPVKVGIDTGLVIDLDKLTLLDPDIASPKPEDARLVPYGTRVDVWIRQSQEEVAYSLVLDGKDIAGITRTGDLHDIALRTGPMTEDVTIQVRATKKFAASANRAPETALLDAKLYLKVTANPGLLLTPDPAAIVNHGQRGGVKITATQPNAGYQAFIRKLADREFIRGVAAGQPPITVEVPDNPPARIRPPSPPDPGHALSAFVPCSDEPVDGNGGELHLDTPALTDDALILVQASKAHRIHQDRADSPVIRSVVRLTQLAAVLVRPDPARALRLQLTMQNPTTPANLQVFNGQPGVFYHFHRLPDRVALPQPAYFHKNDQLDTPQNKGVDQIAMEVDFVVAADAADLSVAPASRAPTPPIIPPGGLVPGETLMVRAVKAQTGLQVNLLQDITTLRLPKVETPAVVDYGAVASIVIDGSDAQDRYELRRDNLIVRAATAGNGGQLSLPSPALQGDTNLEVIVTRPSTRPAVEHALPFRIRVRPDRSSPLSALSNTVAKGAGTTIVVERTQPGVLYQLMLAATPAGSPAAGTGGTLSLPTGPLSADGVFSVTAQRADDNNLTVTLDAQITVRVDGAN